MDEFLDWLKEECLPAIWSKGVALSRNSKSIERLSKSNDSNELKLKMQTTERPLAYQITLWVKDCDAHCDCGSKIEPCHHIVAAALAIQNGTVTEAAAASSKEGCKLEYTWTLSSHSADSAGKLSLKRTLLVRGEPQELTRSLISLIGGIQSGRLDLPLPAVTPQDLKIDECFSKPNPSWREILRLLKDLPPLPLIGHPVRTELEIGNLSDRPLVRIVDTNGDGVGLRFDATTIEEAFENGLVIRNGKLELATHGGNTKNETISKSKLESFMRDRLPVLQETHEVLIETNRLPSWNQADPELRFVVEKLDQERCALTARIEYPPLKSGEIRERNLRAEGELIKRARMNHDLQVDQPKIIRPEEAIERLGSLDPQANSSLLSFVSLFLNSIGGSQIDAALAEKETLLRLLNLRKQHPTQETKINHLIRALSPGSPLELDSSRSLDPELMAQLRDYQKSGVAWLLEKAATLGGAILADDMGLGKTVQTLATLKGKSLVVVPTSLLLNWKNEAQRFRPDLRTLIYHGSERTWDNTASLILTTYSILRLEADRFASMNWSTVILDEAHLIRNPETQAAIAVTKLNASFRLALTGTPIQNRKRDLLSLFQFVAPDLFFNEEELQSKVIAPFFLRRTKEQVLKELPPKTHIDHTLQLQPDEQRLYDSVFAAAKSELLSRLDSNEELSPFTFFEMLLRARQACNHASLLNPEQSDRASTKLTAILNLIDELVDAGHSVLVYSQWTRFLDRIESSLTGKTPFERLDGSTQNRGEIVNRFQSENGAKVFLLSLQAGGVGLNLTRASHVIFCDPWWNPFVELQAEDRAYRMGQEKPVTIHRMLMEGTLEMDIRSLQKEKLKLGEETFGVEELKKSILN